MNKIKIAAVSYLNTKPLLYGLQNSSIINDIELIEEYPAKIADLLLHNKVDMALLPVAILPQLKEYYLISDYCIGSTGNVASVSLFSNCSIDNIETVLLDYQSKTSITLVQVLLKHYWKKNVTLINATEDYINKIDNTTAGVIIGDRALQYKEKFAFDYDLAAAWKSFTGLPFVFATWVANKPLPQNFVTQFNACMQNGLHNIEKVVGENKIEYYSLKKYYTENISYTFDDEKKKALQLFLEYIQQL